MKQTSHSTAYVIVTHGSRQPKSNRAFLRVVGLLRPLVAGPAGKNPVIGAFLEIARPTIPEALAMAARKKVREVVVVPLMLFPGRHAARDIPKHLRDASRRHPRVRFRSTKPLAMYPEFLSFLKEVL